MTVTDPNMILGHPRIIYEQFIKNTPQLKGHFKELIDYYIELLIQYNINISLKDLNGCYQSFLFQLRKTLINRAILKLNEQEMKEWSITLEYIKEKIDKRYQEENICLPLLYQKHNRHPSQQSRKFLENYDYYLMYLEFLKANIIPFNYIPQLKKLFLATITNGTKTFEDWMRDPYLEFELMERKSKDFQLGLQVDQK